MEKDIANFFAGGVRSRDDVAEAIRSAIAVERDQCAAIAIRMHGCDGDQIAAAIRARNNEH